MRPRFAFPAPLLSGLLAAGTVLAAEEPPVLAALVADGRLPPLEQRLPSVPRSDLPERPDWQAGRYGGTLRMLDRGGRDPRALVVLGYARLVVWQRDAQGNTRLVPDILERVEVEAGRIFTLHLRPGHRWSDGQPFTSEDFRFWWEDIANHPDLSPAGPEAVLVAGGELPIFEALDATRVRFTWPVANNRFLPALAATNPTTIFAPAHYLKPLHAGYADPETLNAEARAAGHEGWVERFERLDQPFRYDNPERPSLQPWINVSRPPTERFVGRRNPYFHRVDASGRQLPYIDEVVVRKSRATLIPAKAAAGETDLQSIGLGFADAALLKQAEAEGRIRLALWPIGRGAQLALYPNLNAAASDWRALLRDADFRRALSLGIDREELNSVIYQGLALGGGNSLLPDSPLYRAGLRERWSGYDPETASDLLDALGLDEGYDGVRRMSSGKRLAVVVETGDSDPAEIDALELIRESWREIGLELLIRPRGRQALRSRVRSGAAVMSLFYGLANGLATAESSPAELAPTSDRQNNWPLWGLYGQSDGRAGAAPDLPAVQRLTTLNLAWSRATSSKARRRAWEEMLEIHADQVFTIGLIGRVLQPVAINPQLRNVPESAPYLYDPGAYFGITRPDTYWFAEAPS